MLDVRHDAQDRWALTVRGHEFFVDQPADGGGTDTAPTPVELFVGALASCVAHYARGYLLRHALPTSGLSVTATFEMEVRPARVGQVRLHMTVPDGVPESRRAGLLAVASACTVHNSLVTVPEVSVDLANAVPALA